MPIKLITIDFWNTLFDSGNGEGRNELRLATVLNEVKKYKSDITQELFDSSLKKTWEQFNHIWLNDQRTPSPVESIEYFWSLLGLPLDDEAIDNITYTFANSILDYPPNMLPTKDQIHELASKYKLAIISDTGFSPGTVLRTLIHRNGIYDCFSDFSFSDETGVAKPHKIAFKKVLETLEIKPEEALHIGDIEKTDIKGAKEIGMNAIRFCGDPTAFVVKENPTISAADAVLGSWNEIIDFINQKF